MANVVWSGQADFSFSFTKPGFAGNTQPLFTIPSGLVSPGRGVVVTAIVATEDPGFVIQASGVPSVLTQLVDHASTVWSGLQVRAVTQDSTYPASSCQSNSGGPVDLSTLGSGWFDIIPRTAIAAGLKVMQVVFNNNVFGATHGSMDCRVVWFDSGGTMLSTDASQGIVSSGGSLTFDGLGPPVGATQFSVQMQPIPAGITDQASATATSYCATGTPDQVAVIGFAPSLQHATDAPMALQLGATIQVTASFVKNSVFAGCGESVNGTVVALLLDAQQSTFGGAITFGGPSFAGGSISPTGLFLAAPSGTSGKSATCIFGGVAGIANSAPAPTPSLTGLNWADQIARVNGAFYADLSLWTDGVPEPSSPRVNLDPTISTPAGFGGWGIIQDVAWRLARPRAFGTIV